MSRNGSGTYSLPAGNPVVTNTVISSTWANTTLTDIASALTGSVASDGQTPMSSSLNMASNKIISVTDPTNAQDAATKAYVDAADAILTAAIAAVSSVPTATINMWPTATAPTGYLLCAGSAVSRTTYAALFAVIGTTFGVGDGTTTFNVPNYTNRMPYGTTIGATGGTADAIVVSHTHTATSTVTDPTHNHTISPFSSSPGGGGGTPGGDWKHDLGGTVTTSSSSTGITVATSNASTGSSGTNQNLPPYLGINFIIKT
jgi:microcystin-dependent protein